MKRFAWSVLSSFIPVILGISSLNEITVKDLVTVHLAVTVSAKPPGPTPWIRYWNPARCIT